MNKLVIFFSGRGSNMFEILNTKELYPHIAAIFTDNILAGALNNLSSYKDLKTYAIRFINRNSWEEDITNILSGIKPKLIVLAGFMRILSPEFINKYRGMIINIHPSLLPKYKGLNTHARVLAAKDKNHGFSIHTVTEDLDGGSIILQKELNVLPEDTEESLASRVLTLEHQYYKEIIKELII